MVTVGLRQDCVVVKYTITHIKSILLDHKFFRMQAHIVDSEAEVDSEVLGGSGSTEGVHANDCVGVFVGASAAGSFHEEHLDIVREDGIFVFPTLRVEEVEGGERNHASVEEGGKFVPGLNQETDFGPTSGKNNFFFILRFFGKIL